MDILQADARLLLGGNAYAAGWTAVTREENGIASAAGSVNLFDKAYDPDGTAHRPGVYVGTRELEAVDELDFPTCNAGGRVEYRMLTIPLVIAVQAADKLSARKQRNQLRHNIKVILLGNILQSGYWYELTTDGRTSIKDRVSTTASGGGTTQVAEAMGWLAVQVRYSWSASALA